jgi:hypothetical protein
MRSSWLAAGALVMLSSVVAAGWREFSQPNPVLLVPSLTGQPEYCLTCHGDLPEISASHPVKVFGCVSCHGGQPLALDADLAHSTMRGGANPSDLSVVQQSCGGDACHSGSSADQQDHVERVMSSIQSTYAGAIANILFTYGAEPDLTARFGMDAVTDALPTTPTGLKELNLFEASSFDSQTISNFAANCTSCHVNAQAADGTAYSRFTGCAACHSPVARSTESGEILETHTLATAIPYSQCNTCHNRGNYDLRTMTFVPRADHPLDRLNDYYQPIAQYTRCEYSLDCIDCHTRTEVMGDRDIHSSKKEIQYIQCKTCHGTPTALPLSTTLTDPSDIAFRLAQANPVLDLNPGDTVLMTEQGEPLWNTRVLPDGTYELIGKVTGARFVFRPAMGSGCTQDPTQQTSQYCHECHSVQR